MTPTEMHIEALMEKIESLTAKVKRYEKALEEIESLENIYSEGCECDEVARAALNKTGDT